MKFSLPVNETGGRSLLDSRFTIHDPRFMSIADWPVDDRPREKLIAKGADALSDAELVAIFLRTGVRGKSAVDVARESLTRFGSTPGR
jgi:hypothetical protein